ncbi:flagellar export chaperone FliS [Orenia marismortui]|uniref:flagellar export chaperone FliS n=1 Tax=Orenia marismortui TaxID=46469 RepID=UPI000377FA0F|nr:flagellar export chaperone FliS [Orenia marismortui]
MSINLNEQNLSQEEMLLMLYEGGINFCNQAKEKFISGEFQSANEKIKKVQAIVNELTVTLDIKKGGEIANNLYNLYEYINHRLIQANIRKDPEILKEVLSLLEELKAGWEDAFKKTKENNNTSD